MPCPSCGRGLHRLCKSACDQCHPEPKAIPPVASAAGAEKASVKTILTKLSEATKPETRLHGGTYDKLRDPLSTGRKRAAKLYPLDSSLSCEWAGKRNCGGGLRPIIGCLDGRQTHRHHGPVKNVTRNHEGNVHRICTACHNHWHELNDLLYEESRFALLPHDPQPATEQQIADNLVAWATGEMGLKYQLASSVTARKDYHNEA